MYSDRMAMTPPFSEAAERNKVPILGALGRLLPARGRVLEIGSGTGQHVVHFAPAFPRLSWQPTEQREHLEGLNARIRLEGPPNVLPAIELDVTGPWPDYCFEAVYSSNTAHIMPWDLVQAMFAGVSARMAPRGIFCLYGPFNVDGEFTSASNQEFDRQLRERDRAMGLRDVGALATLAGEQRMRLEECCPLPANNQLLVFRRNERG
jgi:SAM-dependent methyltransferase